MDKKFHIGFRQLLGMVVLFATMIMLAGWMVWPKENDAFRKFEFSENLRQSINARAKHSQLAKCEPNDGCLAIVLDDVGRRPKMLSRLLRLNAPLTFSVLPQEKYTAISLKALVSQSRSIMLHLPLEPHNKHLIKDRAEFLTRDSDIDSEFKRILSHVPMATSINNHMGSAFTEDAHALNRLFKATQRHHLAFLDSKTSPHSLGCKVAYEMNIRCLTRDVFLDDLKDHQTIDQRLDEAANLARARGWAVAIGHPYPQTTKTLISWLGQARKGLKIVAIDHLFKKLAVANFTARQDN